MDRRRFLTFILDALESDSTGQQTSTEDAEALLASINGLPWEQVRTVGGGSARCRGKGWYIDYEGTSLGELFPQQTCEV